MTRQIVLRLSCADVPGIVADIARFVFESGLNIVESAQFYDSDTGRFFMRVVAEPVEGGRPRRPTRRLHAPRRPLRHGLGAARHGAPPRVLIMVSASATA